MASQIHRSGSVESTDSGSVRESITEKYTAISKETLLPAFVSGCSLSAVMDTLQPAFHLVGAIVPFIALPIMLINMNDAVSSTVEEYHLDDGLTSIEKKEIEQAIKSNKKRSLFSTVQYLIPSTLTCVGYFVGLGVLATALPAWSAIAATFVLAIPCYNAHKKMKIYDVQIKHAVEQLGDDHALSCYNSWVEASSKTDDGCLWDNRSTAKKREKFIDSLRSAPPSDEKNRILNWVGQREEQRHTRNLLGQLASVAATIATITVVASILAVAVSPPGLMIALGVACGVGAVIGMHALYRHYKTSVSENIQEDSAALLDRETDILSEEDVRETSVSMQPDHTESSSDAFSTVEECASDEGDFDDAEFFYTEEVSAADTDKESEPLCEQPKEDAFDDAELFYTEEESINAAAHTDKESERLREQPKEDEITSEEINRESVLFEHDEEHFKGSESASFSSAQGKEEFDDRTDSCPDSDDEEGLSD